ncbi:galactose mutarotase [Lepeophtheirus salmonis]|uniref:Galactose mutarotase n=1 Tax=Lepeophtheirus salmonis TaxID=72036 RepID=D3PGN4_LEPSM|nr:galactose mutarotase-like [Lepeophtheirus salmonis]ADD24430.1 Aldose 1-epimerase [Lepeophtheirus salmonis]
MSIFTFLGIFGVLLCISIGNEASSNFQRLVKREEESVGVKITQLESWELPDEYVDNANKKEIKRFSLEMDKITLEVMSLDLVITSLKLPDDNASMSDVVLGFDDVEGYMKNPAFSGVFISLSPDDMDHKSKPLRNWVSTHMKDKLVFSLIKDEEVMVNAEFLLDAEGKLHITFQSLVSQPSFMDISLKQYFNLAGHASGISGLNEQIIQVNAAEVSETPEGNSFVDIDGNDLDLRIPQNIGFLISNENITLGRRFVIDRSLAIYDRFVTRISHGISRRFVEVYSNQPSFYFDVFNKTTSFGKGSEEYEAKSGVEISTGTLFDEKELSIVIPGDVYKHIVVYRFGVDEF